MLETAVLLHNEPGLMLPSRDRKRLNERRNVPEERNFKADRGIDVMKLWPHIKEAKIRRN
jgi:hypothetical protein